MDTELMIHRLLRQAVEEEASDLHLTTGAPPFLRVNGEIILMDEEPLTAETSEQLVLSLLNDAQKDKLAKEFQLCFSKTVAELGYFRINVYRKRGMIEMAVRIGMLEMKPIEELGLSPMLGELTRRPHGLVLITGPTGQGKTTTLNAMIDFINRERRCKIITIEDPVEYVHRNIRSIVVQQELFTDCHSIHGALVHILRQDPDVIGVGEMREIEAISGTITAAETGHLVLATLHTNDCAQTIHRIVDVFPPARQEQIRVQVSASLVCIFNQKLLPRADRKGRIPVYEMLIANEAVRNLIRENKVHQLQNIIQTSRTLGMTTMDESIRDFYQQGIISYDTALSNVRDPRVIKADARPSLSKPPVAKRPVS